MEQGALQSAMRPFCLQNASSDYAMDSAKTNTMPEQS